MGQWKQERFVHITCTFNFRLLTEGHSCFLHNISIDSKQSIRPSFLSKEHSMVSCLLSNQ